VSTGAARAAAPRFGRVVLASGNPGKLAELRELFAGTAMQIVARGELGIGEADETGLTFVENALLKARHAAAATGLPAMADDSGLEVDALDGAPGIHSARYAGMSCNDAANIERLLQEMAQVPDRRRVARFHCVMVFLRHALDPTPLISEGVWAGTLARAPRGTGGFGYDPVFYVPEHGCAAAELAPATKNALSHRGQAARGLARLLEARYFSTAAAAER